MTFAEYTKKKKEKEKQKTETPAQGKSFKEYTEEMLGVKVDEDIGPVRETEEQENNRFSVFKAGALEDGYQFGDILRTSVSTALDAKNSMKQGVANMGEGVVDLILHGVAGAADMVGADSFADAVKETANRNYVDEAFDFHRDSSLFGNYGENSLLDDFGRKAAQGIGQAATSIATAGLGAAAGLGTAGIAALTTGTTFASSAGSGISEAYNEKEDISSGEAFAYGTMKGAIDAGTELLSGGLGKAVSALGISRGIGGLDDMFAKKLSSKLSNHVVRNAAQYGVKAAGEGLEEVIAEVGTAAAKKLTYMSDAELKDLVSKEDLLESFVLGTFTGAVMQGGDLVQSVKDKTDYVTGMTENEQKVFDKVYETAIAEREADGTKLTQKEKNSLYESTLNAMEKGYIDTDTIESVLGGESYNRYKSLTEQENKLKQEIESLENLPKEQITVKQSERLTEARKELASLDITGAKNRLNQEVSEMARADRLGESYNERARRSSRYEADLELYDDKQRVVIQKAMDSGILNNTNRTHEFVDMIAKISADKGVLFDFTDNKKLKESGFALEGKTVNGFLKDGNISLNINSAKALNVVVGHEITHVLEGTELYGELRQAVKAYAESKGEYGKRLEAIQKLYEGVEGADIENELTADIIGDYLFTDSDFVNRLSAERPGLFKRLFEEIKYLVKTATAGSKQARELEKVKRTFEKAYRENGATTNADGKIKYSINSKFYEQLDNWDGKTEGFAFVVGDTSEALQKAGIPRKQIRWDASKIATLLKKHSGMTRETVKGIPELLENPVIVIDSKKGDNSKIVMGELYDENGKIVTAVLLLTPTSKKGNVLDLVKISSAEGRSHIGSLFKKEDGTPVTIRYVDKKRIQNWLNVNRLQLPLHNHIMDSNSIIPQNEKSASGAVRNSLGEDIAPIGGFKVRGEDIELGPVRSDIAPVQQSQVMEDIGPVREDIAQVKQKTSEEKTSDEDQSATAFWGDDLPTWNEVEKKTPAADSYAPEPVDYPRQAVKTVKERNAVKLQNLKVLLRDTQELMKKSHASFNSEIGELQAEYNVEKNKNTEEAQELLYRMESLKASRDNMDASYEWRIEKIRKKIDKMNTKDFKIVEQRMSKQEEYQARMGELIGDTSTWVDKKMGIYYKVNTLRRNLRDIVRDENGNRDIEKADAIYDELQGSYNHNEAKLNREANRIKQVYADMKINAAEDAYIQMLGEYKYNPDTTITTDAIQEYYEKYKDKIDTVKVDEAIESARTLYDDLFLRVNEVLKENGFREMGYRKGYFPHFTDEKQGWLAKLLNWKTKKDTIPTSIAGITETFRPNRSYQSFDKHRTGDETDYSFKKGLDMYVQGALDWIYHIEDIQKRRAFENEIRYRHSDKGIRDKIEAIHNNTEYDADEMQAQIDLVYNEAKNPLNNFVADFRTQTNTLAGKKSSMDRGTEEWTNREFYSVMTNLSNRVTANMVGGSISSALTNFIPITQSWAQVSPKSSLIAMRDVVRSYYKDDGIIEKSDFLTNRLEKTEKLYKTGWDKFGDKIGWLMETVDNFTTQTVWRSKYLENMNAGMSENEAIKNADQFAENVMAGRSRGNNPTIFDAKNPFAKMLTAFQLEVNNQYGYLFKDVPQELRNETKGKLVKGYAGVFIGAYVYNKLYSALTGRDAAFDPIGIVEDLLRDLGLGGDDEEKEPAEVVLNLTDSILDEVPFVGGLLGGGRIPISAALPYDGLYEAFKGTVQDVSEKNWKSLTSEWLNPVAYLLPPVGGGQVRKTLQGLAMFDDDLPIAGSYTNSGKLRFAVEDTAANKIQAGVFGQWAGKTAREYIEDGRTALNEKQTQELIDSGMSMQEYWEYRDGLKGLSTLGEKAEYINSLDVPIETKNLLINNLSERKEAIDMSDYDAFEDFEEFDFAIKNPEKYEFLQKNGISYNDYKNADEKGKNAYTWASKNPGGYAVSRVVTEDVVEYRKYVSELNQLTADKDENGKPINGSVKAKTVEYINNLPLNYGQRMILFKSVYPGDDTYNYEIVEYLNGQENLTYGDIAEILTELEFTVQQDGTVTW